jgi:hypothetical protein
MPLNMRSMITLIRKGAILLLALAVFGFGLHARLEAYKSPPSKFNPTSAKISTKQHSEQLLNEGIKEQSKAKGFVSMLAFGLGWSSIFAEENCNPIIQTVEIGLFNPTRYDQKGDYSLHRPPPSLT